LKLGNGLVFGNPYTALTSYSTTGDRGMYIKPLGVLSSVRSIAFGGFDGSMTGAKILKSFTASTATPGWDEVQIITNSARVTGGINLMPNQAYRIVMTCSGGSGHPQYAQIGDYDRYTDVQAAAWGGGNVYSTYYNGSSWVDEPSKLPRMTVELTQIVTLSNSQSF
jgi:hypothetical protein